MRRALRIAAFLLVILAVGLAVNTIVLDNETKPAAVDVAGGKILRLQGGDVQVTDNGPRDAAPIVLLHCFTCAIDWWDELAPRLQRDHRVIAIDLLGHGGSDKPGSGYSMPDQAQLVAEALGQLGVRDATVVGHSLGGTVATALAESSPELVNRVVIIDQAPDSSYGSLDLVEKLGFVPVIGEALWRLKTDSLVREGLSQAFAPGYDVPDQFVADVNRMTYTSYADSASDEMSFTDEKPLDARLEPLGKPLLVIFGSEDQIYDPRPALSAYADIPGAQTRLIQGAGHSPNVEKPAQTAALIQAFTRDAPSIAKQRAARARAVAKALTEKRKKRAAAKAQTKHRPQQGHPKSKSGK